MPDFSPFIVAALAVLAVFATVRAYVGRVDRSVPLCRRCGRDAREFVWREDYQCECAAALASVGTVHFPRRRSKRLVALAILLLVATGFFAWWAVMVRASGTGWRDQLPISMYARVIERGWDHPWHLSATRRLFDDCSVHDAELLRDAALARWESGEEPTPELWRTLGMAAAIAQPEGAIGERYARATARQFEFVASQRDANVVLRLHRTRSRWAWERLCLGHIGSVTVDGADVPFSVRHVRGRDANKDLSRAWFVFDSTDLEVTIPDRTLSDGAKIRVAGALATLVVPSDLARSDEIIATNDPSKWGVHYARAPFEARAVTTESASPDSTSLPFDRWRQWSQALWGGDQLIETMPSAAAVPIVVTAMVAIAVALVIALAVPLARAAARGRTRLAPPGCRKCGALLRAEGEALPSRCTECGASIASRHDCSWVVVPSRMRRAACWITAGAAVTAAIGFAPALYRGTYGFVDEMLATPEANAAWLVDATIAYRPGAMELPGQRLAYSQGKSAPDVGAATAELLHGGAGATARCRTRRWTATARNGAASSGRS